MHISVIGTGYVGVVTGACFAEFGLNVMCMDTDAERIARLEKGDVPFHEPGLAELVGKGLRDGRLEFSTDIAQAIEKALVIFVAVGTPSRSDGSADLSSIEEVARNIARHMDGYKVITTKSTVPVGTAQRMRDLIKKDQTAPYRFDMVSNPEFLREGSAIEDFLRPDRVVIGAESPEAIAIMKDLYQPLYLIETPFVVTNIATAEMVKYASNVFLATKISFINEIATLCEKVDADVQVVAKAMGLDQRIGPKFLHAGPGFGGSCFSKDTSALIQIGHEAGVDMQIAHATSQVNQQQRLRMLTKIEEIVGPLSGKTLGMLGLSFKPNTDDLRDSPALAIAERLIQMGCTVRAYDPAALGQASQLVKDLTPCHDPYEVAESVDALILATEWNQFRNLDLERLKAGMRAPVFIDLRNVYDPERMAALGFRYAGVGRASKSATH